MNKLFVYGTLKRGYNNHRLIKRSRFLGNDEAPGDLYGGRWGAPIVTPGMGWVKGELFLVDDETLAHCDALEGHPHGYTRTTVVLKSGEEAFIYYWLHSAESRELIESGEWSHD